MRSTGGNRRLAQWRVTWLIEHSTSHQLLWCIVTVLYSEIHNCAMLQTTDNSVDGTPANESHTILG